ncbi:hypothetical protein AYO44_06250 [Planctomycetaceae bacterium SCGC AG-212-F19]|nr:hypothetical protein AYO44_06250 [Planctomycetaceae bacterium SCGC AG-212-F19]
MTVRRSRRLPLEALAPYLLNPPAEAGVLSWPTIFGNDHLVEIEVGFGKGLFLLESSQSRPAVNFLGIEIMRKYQLFAATRLAKRGLGNVRLMCADARRMLAEAVPPASVQAVHVYFPDPWWKTRHRKRRLFTPEFAGACTRVLAPGARLFLISDVETYFGIMQDTVRQHTPLVAEDWPDAAPGEPDGRTNFERKYRREGRAIYRALYRKEAG